MNEKRKLARLNSGIADEISNRIYNLIIGIILAYGLFINAVLVMFFGDFFMKIDSLMFLVVYFISCLAGIIITVRSNNPYMSFLGYNLVVVPMGGLLAACVPSFYIQDIIRAAFMTAVIVSVMTIIATIKPYLFHDLGPTLFISLLFSFIAEIISVLFGYHGSIFNWIFVIIFSLYVGFDWMKSQEYPKTVDNAVDSALDIYLDIINLFIRLLSILSKSNSRD